MAKPCFRKGYRVGYLFGQLLSAAYAVRKEIAKGKKSRAAYFLKQVAGYADELFETLSRPGVADAEIRKHLVPVLGAIRDNSKVFERELTLRGMATRTLSDRATKLVEAVNFAEEAIAQRMD